MEQDIDFPGLAALLRGAREGRNLRLREVAKQTGVSASTLSRIERQQAQPDMRTIQAVAQWIGVPLGRIFHRAVPDDAKVVPRSASRPKAPTAPLDAVEVQFRADPNLSPQAAEALIKIVRTAYRGLVESAKK